jgi:hypothetical protein
MRFHWHDVADDSEAGNLAETDAPASSRTCSPIATVPQWHQLIRNGIIQFTRMILIRIVSRQAVGVNNY